MLRLKTLHALYELRRNHRGHNIANLTAQAYYRQKFARKYIRRWRVALRVKVKENQQVSAVKSDLNALQKQRVLRGWRAAMIELKMEEIQKQTANHVYKKSTITKCFFAMHAFTSYSNKWRYLNNKCELGNDRRLAFKAFKAWQRSHLRSAKLVEMRFLAEQLRTFALKRRSFRGMRVFKEVQSHARGLRNCADLYYSLSLKKVAVHALHRYWQIREGEREKAKSVDMYYENRLKYRLFRFLHESNIQFIEKFVIIENFLQKKQLRKYLKILNQAVSQQKARLMTFKPNPSQLYLVSLWQSQQKLQFKLSTGFQIGKSQYQLRRNESSTQKLSCFVKANVFSVWKKHTEAIRKVKNRVFLKRKTIAISLWIAYVAKKLLIQKKLEIYLNNKTRVLLKRMMRCIRFDNQHHKKDLSKTARFQQICESRKTRNSWMLWRTKFQRNVIKRSQKLVAFELQRAKLMTSFWSRWQKKFAIERKKTILRVKQEAFCQNKFKYKKFYQWMHGAKKRLELEKIDTSIETVGRTKTLQFCLRSWVLYVNRRRQNQSMKQFARKRFAQVLVNRVFLGWHSVLPTLKQKKELYGAIKTEQQGKVVMKVFQVLKLHKDFKLEQQVTDHLMTKAVRQVTQKRFFRSWRGLVDKRVGLALFAMTMEKIRQRLFFKRVSRGAFFEQSVKEHMALVREFKLQEICLRALHKHATRKARAIQQTKDVLRMRFELKLRVTFGAWRADWCRQRRGERITHFTIVQIKRSIQKKYFQELKEQTRLSLIERNVEQCKSKSLKKNCFLKFRRHVRRVNMGKKLLQMRQKQRKHFILQKWIREVEGIFFGRQQLNQAMITRFRKVFLFWRWQAKRTICLEEKLQKGNFNHNLYLVKSVFEALFDFKAAKTLRQRKAVTFRKKESNKKLDICFGALFENAAVKKDYKKKAAVIKAKTDRREYTDLWATWRKAAAPRFARYEALKNSVGCSKRYLARHALLEWREFVEYVQRMETLVTNYSIEKARAKGIDCLRALKTYAHNSSLRRHRNQSIYNFAETKHTYKVFAAFVQSISEMKSRRHNTGRALDFQRGKLLESAFRKMQKFSIKATLDKSRMTIAFFKRLLPKAFVSWKIFREARIERRQKRMKAVMFLSDRLILQAFQGLLEKVVSNKKKREIKAQTQEVYEQKSMSRHFGLWTQAVQSKKIMLEKRKFLFVQMLRVDRGQLLRHVFLEMKGALQREVQQLMFKRLVLNRQKAIRQLLSWRAVAVYQRNLKLKQAELSQTHKERSIQRFFLTWYDKLSSELKVKLLQATSDRKLLAKTFGGFQMMLKYKQVCHFSDKFRENVIRRRVLDRLFKNISVCRKLRDDVQEMVETMERKTRVRVLLSLRYHTLIQKSAILVQQKTQQKLQVMAMDALKYFTMQKRIQKKYVELKENKTCRAIFYNWHLLFSKLTAQKQVMGPLLARIDAENKALAFRTFRRNVFKQKFIERLQMNFTLPHQVDLATRCLRGWRKYAYLQRNKTYFQKELEISREQRSKRDVFGLWLSVVMKLVPARALIERTEAAMYFSRLRSGFEALTNHSQKLAVMEQAADQLEEHRRMRKLTQVLSKWRWEFEEQRRIQAVRENVDYRITATTFGYWRKQLFALREKKQAEALEQQAFTIAKQYNEDKQVRKCFEGLLAHLEHKKKYKGAEAFREATLEGKAFQVLKNYRTSQQARGSPNPRVHFFKAQCQVNQVKGAFDKWRDRSNNKQRTRTVVATFKLYRQQYLTAKVFDILFKTTQQSKKMAQICEKAQQYFRKKMDFRTKQVLFHKISQYSHHRVEARLIKEHQEDQALEYRAYRLQAQAFLPWKNFIRNERRGKQRSRMYTVYSAWKFYTKERVLLKKYLQECGGNQADMSMMTTVEMRQSADRMGVSQTSNPTANEPSVQQTFISSVSVHRTPSVSGADFAPNSSSIRPYNQKQHTQPATILQVPGVSNQMLETNPYLRKAAYNIHPPQKSIESDSASGEKSGKFASSHLFAESRREYANVVQSSIESGSNTAEDGLHTSVRARSHTSGRSFVLGAKPDLERPQILSKRSTARSQDPQNSLLAKHFQQFSYKN